MDNPVETLLKEKNVYYNISGRDFVVKCLNPDHDDSNPSMRIDKTTGIFNCFSCGFKGDLFKYYGILSNHTFIKVAKLKEKIRLLQQSNNGLSIPASAVPYSRAFRGVSAATLNKFGAFYLPNPDKELHGFEDRIIFPISDITGKISAFQGRHTLSNGNPKYIFYPSGVQIHPFPASVQPNTKSIVLVEGIFDFLNCYDKGLTNAVCVFGTNALQKNTRDKLFSYKLQGVEKVYIMFDGDDAGREAAKKLKPSIEQMELSCEIITLEDDSDPGSLSQDYIDSIKEYING